MTYFQSPLPHSGLGLENSLATLHPVPSGYDPGLQQDPLMLHSLAHASAIDLSPAIASNVASPPAPGSQTFTVTSTADIVDASDGVLTLREAIQAANANLGADTINFDLGSGAKTITLINGQLQILDDLIINGTGAANLTISGNRTSRVFQVGSTPIIDWIRGQFLIANAPTVTLKDMTIAHGQAAAGSNLWGFKGGGIFNTGKLTVINSVLEQNVSDEGGGIANNWGTLSVINSTLRQNSATSWGGGISNTGTLQVINTTISSNSVSMGLGGGIYSGSNLTLIGSTITDNEVATNGGGIYTSYNADKTTTIRNTTIARNTAGDGTHDVIGGFTSEGGNVIGVSHSRSLINGVNGDRVGTDDNRLQPLLNLTVDTLVDEMDGNYSAGDLSLREALSLISRGGTINFAGNLSGTIALNMGELLLEKNVTIDGPGANRLTISGNQRSRVMAVASYVNASLEGFTIANGFSQNNGGGIRMNLGSQVTLTNMMVNNNTAGDSTGGGGIWNDRGTLTAINSSFSGNQAGFGGAILNGNGVFLTDRTSTVNLSNTTITENQALLGGGILNQIGSLNLTSSTVSANWGMGVVNAGSATVHNTIVAGNLNAVGSPGADLSGAFISKGYNLIGNGTGSTGFGSIGDRVGNSQQPIDPKLGPLEDYNGPLYTMLPLWGSAAINAGDPTLIAERDQNGVLRSQHGRPDIGAVEWINQAPTATNDFVSFKGRSVTFNPLGNDVDREGHALRITSYSSPNNGTLTRNADGTFTYTASSSLPFGGSLTNRFTYTIVDEFGATSTATVTLHQRP